METINTDECKVHALVCTNEKPGGKACCFKVGGQELFTKLKTRLKEEKLYDTHWITRTGCLGFCNDVGTTVAIYAKDKEPRWFFKVTDADYETIWNEITR